MFDAITRRGFVTRSLQAGALAGLGDFAFLKGLPTLTAGAARVTPKTVQFNPDIEPLVRLIEDTDRKRVLEAVAVQIRGGASYQDLLSAVFLAGVRGIQPRPVGFKFHAVLVINSAHLASLAAQDNDRWLPLFWAVDNFKSSQARNKEEGDWRMPPVDDSKLPSSTQAKQRFIEAMDNWDEEAADRAIVALVRTAGAGEIIELFWRYGCRDFRDIGHKAIFVANSWRTLQAIGWRHAEPVLRSLTYALLEHEGGNPAKRDDDRDRHGRENLQRLQRMGHLSQTMIDSPDAGLRLRNEMRAASPADACEMVATMTRAGIKPDCIWDGLFLTAGELLMRQPGIVGLHCMTSINALHFAYQNTANDETRRLLMLQGAAFLPLFRQAMTGRGKLSDASIVSDEVVESKGDANQAIEEILHDVSKDRMLAARKTRAFADRNPDHIPDLLKAARRLIFSKGNDSHDYKFSSAALEDYYHLRPCWRKHYLAASMFNLKGANDPDNGLVQRTRAALVIL
jgi:hypothetical protein